MDISSTQSESLSTGNAALKKQKNTIRTVQVEEKYQNVKLLDSKHTMASKLAGESVGGKVFTMVKRTSILTSLLFFLSVIVGLLCMLGILPSWAGWLSLVGGFRFLPVFGLLLTHTYCGN